VDKPAIKPNTKVWLSDMVHVERIGPLPAGVTLVDGLGDAVTAVAFTANTAALTCA
jgi:hypothetical protein